MTRVAEKTGLEPDALRFVGCSDLWRGKRQAGN